MRHKQQFETAPHNKSKKNSHTKKPRFNTSDVKGQSSGSIEAPKSSQRAQVWGRGDKDKLHVSLLSLFDHQDKTFSKSQSQNASPQGRIQV